MRLKSIFFSIAAAFVLNPSLAFPQSATTPTPSSWWIPLASGIIAAFAALTAPVIKDLFIQKRNERRNKSESQREVFRNYAAPMVATCEKLVWRFSEVFIDKRHQFLKVSTLPLVYNEYKRRSTLYRIACMLGWIRAINLELSALPRGASGFLIPVSKAINGLQSALADGPHVEIHRLRQMCVVWGIDISNQNETILKEIATKFEIKLYEFAGESLKHHSDLLRSVKSEEKLRICGELARFLSAELKITNISDEIVAETVNRAISAMSYREALVYRDWQDAIGDSMLESDTTSVRRFRVIGYERFEQILMGESLWMEVFRESIDDIDFETTDSNDFRTGQLKDIARAASNILITLSKTEERDLVDEHALAAAIKLIEIK